MLALWLAACPQIKPLQQAHHTTEKPLSLEEVKSICEARPYAAVKVDYITIPAELETITEPTRDTGHWGMEIIKIPAEYNADGSIKTPARTVRHRDIHPFEVKHVERQVIKTPAYELKRTTMHDGRVEEEPLSDLCSKYRGDTL